MKTIEEYAIELVADGARSFSNAADFAAAQAEPTSQPRGTAMTTDQAALDAAFAAGRAEAAATIRAWAAPHEKRLKEFPPATRSAQAAWRRDLAAYERAARLAEGQDR